MSDEQTEDTEDTTEDTGAGTEEPEGEEERRAPDAMPSDDEIEQIEQEREERLDPENRPNNAQVDNTQRDFDEDAGEFQDDGDESDLTDEERAVTADG